MKVVKVYITGLLLLYGLSICQAADIPRVPAAPPAESDTYLDGLSQRLYVSYNKPGMYEIDDIILSGNKSFTFDELIERMLTRKTERSLPHEVLFKYYKELNKNKPLKRILPPQMIRSFDKIIGTMEGEVYYFERGLVEQDVISLKEFYNINGFHDADIHYIFGGDTTEKKNILGIKISEGNQYKVATIDYIGLDSVPGELAAEINSKRKLREGRFFSEEMLLDEVAEIYKILKNNGYYYSSIEILPVKINKEYLHDSVFVVFRPGTRTKISSVTFIDSTKNQSIVGAGMKQMQMETKPGSWYSMADINKSQSNLYSLGTFDIVSIDTSSMFSPVTDSSLGLKVFLQYRKQQEWSLGWFLNVTTMQTYNTGIEANYLHRNIFGAAQVIKPFIRYTIKDLSKSVNDIINGKEPEWEGQFGFSFAQPLITVIDGARLSMVLQPSYYYQRISYGLTLNTVSIPVKFPIKLHSNTFFNSLSIDFSFESQTPKDLQKTKGEVFLDKNYSYRDSLYIISTFRMYDNLENAYISKGSDVYLTANLLGLTVYGDTRNDPFSPRKGYYTSIDYEGYNPVFWGLFEGINAMGAKIDNIRDDVLGIANFHKLSFTSFWFVPGSRNVVYAFKLRAGHIIWNDRENSYIPFDRQFFGGGANSVRGWPSRRLRYSKKGYEFYDNITGIDKDRYFAQYDFVGGLSLIEGSFEWRFKFIKPAGTTSSLMNLLENFGVVYFIDFGNVFGWATVADTSNSDIISNNLSLGDYLEGLAVSTGAGIRFDTPVGPARLDFALPVYFPSSPKSINTIFSRQSPLSYLQIHFALGHAF